MRTVAVGYEGMQAPRAPDPGQPQPSAYGGVLLLARGWAALGGSARLGAGLRWQGRAFELLLFALVALPLLPARSVAAVAGACARAGDPLWAALGWGARVGQRRLARFVASARHDWGRAMAAMVAALDAQPATHIGPDGVIAVDSTVAEKRYGREMAERRPVYDSARKKLVDGYEVVSAAAADARVAWPVGLVPHRKAATPEAREAQKRRRRKAAEGELPSKLDLALGLVAAAVAAGVAAQTVAGDGAFCAMWWLREVAALGRHWLVATRSDRRLRIGAAVGAFRDFAGQLPLSPVAADPEGGTLWGGLLPEATLLERHCSRKGLPCRPAYFERRDKRGKVVHRWYLVTSQLGWDLATTWRHWQWRWEVEVFHREAKQFCGLADFHVRTWEAIVALVACASLRAGLLCYLRAVDPTCGALSMEALVAALRQAACTVEQRPGAPALVSPPPTLPALILWRETRPPLPPEAWPIAYKEAA